MRSLYVSLCLSAVCASAAKEKASPKMVKQDPKLIIEDEEPSFKLTPELIEEAEAALHKRWNIGTLHHKSELLEKLIINLGGKIRRRARLTRALELELPLGPNDDESHPIIEALKSHSETRWIERDFARFPMAEQVPYGITTVQSQRTWNASDSPSMGEDVVVCVIDGGLDATHEDFVDADIVNTNAYSEWEYDGCNHGNHVSGTIAAVTFNDKGVASVAPKASQWIERVFSGSSCAWSATSGLIGASENCVFEGGAKVISMSLGGSYYSNYEDESYEALYREYGVLPVAAAGNSGDSSYSYPASYPTCFSVAATNSGNNKAGFSQYNDQVDIAAPGVSVLSTVTSSSGTSSYASYSGTSMATPHVSGVAALLFAIRPDLPASRIRYCMEHTALDLGAAGRDNSYGFGLVQSYAASRCVLDVEHSDQDCDYVISDGLISGFDACQKSADTSQEYRYWKKTLYQGQCNGYDTYTALNSYTSLADCEAGTNGLVSYPDYEEIQCSGFKEDSCTTEVRGYAVASNVDCDAITNVDYFDNEATLLERSIVIGVCVEWEPTAGARESYRFDVVDGTLTYSLFEGFHCDPDYLISREAPPPHCQTAGSTNMLRHIDSDVSDGQTVWLDWEVADFQEITTPAPVESPEIITTLAEVTTAEPGRVIYEDCTQGKAVQISQKVTTIEFKMTEEEILDSDEIFVSLKLNETLIDNMTVSLSHDGKSVIIMDSMCENIPVSLQLKISDYGNFDVSQFCSDAGVWNEVASKESLNDTFFGEVPGGNWYLTFVDDAYDQHAGKIDRACVGFRDNRHLSAAPERLSLMTVAFASLFAMIFQL